MPPKQARAMATFADLPNEIFVQQPTNVAFFGPPNIFVVQPPILAIAQLPDIVQLFQGKAVQAALNLVPPMKAFISVAARTRLNQRL